MRLLKSVFSTSTSSRIACGDTEQLWRGLTATKYQMTNHQRNSQMGYTSAFSEDMFAGGLQLAINCD